MNAIMTDWRQTCIRFTLIDGVPRDRAPISCTEFTPKYTLSTTDRLIYRDPMGHHLPRHHWKRAPVAVPA
jgi:hypothetical protein